MTEETDNLVLHTDRHTNVLKVAWFFLLIFIFFDLLFVFIFIASRAPLHFPLSEPIVIEKGMSASAVADLLKQNNVVRSSGILYSALVLLHDPSGIKAGSYIFDSKESAFEIARIITSTIPQSDLLKMTFPEGLSVTNFSEIAGKNLPNFNREIFIELAKDTEGYLFPDTYFVPPDYTEAQLVVLLKENFKTKTAEMNWNHESLSKEEIVILASVIEREANTEESMKIVSGILQNRIKIGMPLQADASIEYILNKPLAELTPEDLEIESPYNTYLNPNLPPTPIGNPGIQAIESVLDPKQTAYFYYLTDADGDFHYAKTYTEHQENIARYLR